MKKQEFFINSVQQVELGIYIPSETIERKPKKVYFNETFNSWMGYIDVQGVKIVVECEDQFGEYEVDMTMTRQLLKQNNKIS